MITNINIRQATASDIPEIATVLVDTWQVTFRGLLSDEYLDGMSVEQQVKRYHKILARPQVCCFVATDETDRIVGFCCGGPNRSPALAVSTEIYALYVRNDRHRCGLGRRLFNSTARQLLSTADSILSVWVIASNPSRPFYERIGGKQVAQEDLVLGSDTVTQVAYIWTFSPN